MIKLTPKVLLALVVLTERMRLPPGPLRAGHSDHPEIFLGSALVRSCHRVVHQSRQRPQLETETAAPGEKPQFLGVM